MDKVLRQLPPSVAGTEVLFPIGRGAEGLDGKEAAELATFFVHMAARINSFELRPSATSKWYPACSRCFKVSRTCAEAPLTESSVMPSSAALKRKRGSSRRAR